MNPRQHRAEKKAKYSEERHKDVDKHLERRGNVGRSQTCIFGVLRGGFQQSAPHGDTLDRFQNLPIRNGLQEKRFPPYPLHCSFPACRSGVGQKQNQAQGFSPYASPKSALEFCAAKQRKEGDSPSANHAARAATECPAPSELPHSRCVPRRPPFGLLRSAGKGETHG